MAETSDRAEYFAKALFGGLDEQKFVREMAGVFSLAMVGVMMQKAYPDAAERKSFVDKYVLLLEQQADQDLAKHREMMDSTMGKMLGGMLGTAEGTAAQYKEKVDALRTYLYDLAGVEA